MTDDEDRDGRSATARGYVLASRATSIGFQMAVPTGLGWWADSAWHTSPWLMITGAVLGFVLAMFEILQFASDANREELRARGGRSDKNQSGSP